MGRYQYCFQDIKFGLLAEGRKKRKGTASVTTLPTVHLNCMPAYACHAKWSH